MQERLSGERTPDAMVTGIMGVRRRLCTVVIKATIHDSARVASNPVEIQFNCR